MKQRRWRWIAGGLLLLLAALVLIFVSGQRRAAGVGAYQETLEQLTTEVVTLNLPLADAFARGVIPDEDLIKDSHEQLQIVQEELEALGSPPHELAESQAALVEATSSFRKAFNRLVENMAADGSALSFDQEFLLAAAHGGDAIHRTTAELGNSTAFTSCYCLRRLLPAWWLWI